MSQPNRERERSDEAAQRHSSQQQTTSGAATQQVPVRAERYLVAPMTRHPSMTVTDPAQVQRAIDALSEDPEIHIVRIIPPTARGSGQSTPVAVVEMAPDHAARLAASPQFYVEADHPLRYGTAALPYTDPGITPFPDDTELTVQVEDPDGGPLAGAAVYLVAEHPARAVTGDDGRAVVTLPAREVDSIAGVYVQPRYDHWSAWLGRPRLTTAEPNRIVCTRLEPSAAEGWSRRAMGFDRLPPTFRGHGVKVAIIDSGVATTHEDLAERVLGGRDVVNQDDKSWQEDVVGFGTLAAGLIAATQDRSKVTGLAPEVELQVCKVSPGGRFGDLIEALDYCLTQNVDIVDLGVGSPYPSLLVAQKIEEARQAGVACIAAAGSNPGSVAFPANLPTVLAVAAIGKLGTFPPDSYHATQLSSTPTPDGYFCARFSGYGPEIDVCAPGVGVISTLPPSNLGALDGTAVATAHVAALAALVLAHHPDFRNGYQIPGAVRVDRLFEILRASCRPLPFNDRLRVGAGLPDAVAAVGLAPGPAYSVPPMPGSSWAAMTYPGLTPTGTTPIPGVPGATTAPTYPTVRQHPYDIGTARSGPHSPEHSLAELRVAMYSAGLTPELTPPEQSPA
jgi:hypothetical protein